MKLTDTIARTTVLARGKTDMVIWDTQLTGFCLRIRKVAKGVNKYWLLQYRDSLGASRRFIIGTVSEIGVTKAREIAGELLAEIRLGKYPHIEREKQRKAAEHERDRAIETFGAISALYLERQQRALRERSFYQVKRHIEKDWAPFHRASIHDIDRRSIALRVTEIATKGGPVAANRARTTLSGFFTWAVREGLVENNPVLNTNKAIDEAPRDRVLTDGELAAIWAACEDDTFGRAVRILMLTGQRRAEVGGMRWDELDLEQGLWMLASDRVKNGKRHLVPLVPEVVAILKKMPRATAGAFGQDRVRKLVAREAGARCQDYRSPRRSDRRSAAARLSTDDEDGHVGQARHQDGGFGGTAQSRQEGPRCRL
jgi:integrase